MKNIKWFCVVAGIILFVISFSSFSMGNVYFILIPLFLGVIYFLYGIGILSAGTKVNIFLKYMFAPILGILAGFFDKYLTGLPYYDSNSIYGGWYTGSGVCTENTFCAYWGLFLIGGAAIISFAIGIIKLIGSHSQKTL